MFLSCNISDCYISLLYNCLTCSNTVLQKMRQKNLLALGLGKKFPGKYKFRKVCNTFYTSKRYSALVSEQDLPMFFFFFYFSGQMLHSTK